MNTYHEKFKDKTDKELLEIVNNPSKFQNDAVIAAIDILTERGIELTEEQKAIKFTKESKPEASLSEKKIPKRNIGIKRLLAIIIDLIVLAAASYIVGYILMENSLANGFIPITVSALLIIGYFAIGNSNLLNGATYGKRKMKIKVTGEDNEPINLGKSLIRSLLLIGPFILLEYLDEIEINSSILSVLITTLQFSYFIALIFYFLMDRKLKRLYHDIIQKTFVSFNDETVNYKPFPKKYSYYYAGIVVLVFLTFITLNFQFGKQSDYHNESKTKEMQMVLDKNMEVFTQIIKEIKKIDDVETVNEINLRNSNDKQTDLVIDIQSKVKPSDYVGDNLAKKVYATLNGKNLYVDRIDNVLIKMRYGFDMPLAKFNSSKTIRYEQ
jgi:uncharacterized RDD family membrane protein YckC